MWTRLFRPGAQSTRYDHDLDHETSPTHTKRLFIAASAFFLDLSSSSVLKISLVIFLFPPSHHLRLLRCSAPPKPPLDQERLQLIDFSCIKHPGAYTRGVFLCAAIRGTLQHIVSRYKTGARLSFVLPRWTPVEYNRYSCWSGGCIYAKKDINLWILSGIYNIELDLEKRLGWHTSSTTLGILIELRNFESTPTSAGLHNILQQPWIITISEPKTGQHSTNS